MRSKNATSVLCSATAFLTFVVNLLLGGDFILDNCTHEEAVNALKRCKDKVVLVVSKAETPFPSSPTIGQIPYLAPSNFNKPVMARSVSEEELTGPRQVILQKSAAGKPKAGSEQRQLK